MKNIGFPALMLSLTTLLIATPAAAELPAGHPPLPGTERENRDNTASASVLPNEGQVLNTFQSGGYRYIEVTADGTSQWLAAPLIEVEKGMRIRYSKGVPMANFYSKSLDKTFERILLVGKIKVVKP